MPTPLLEMKGITKAFGGNTVLRDVDFTLWPGQVHALVGENGAGKSTLMKILSGVYATDHGSILLDGRELPITNPHDARRAGVGMIYQEHTLAPHLTVAENIFLGLERTGALGLLDNPTMEEAIHRLLASHNLPLDPRTRVERLSLAEKQLVEIARALTRAHRILVMDEPTSMLSRRDADALFEIIVELKSRGLAVVYISHRMDELAKVADTITILRDGRRVFSGSFSGTSEQEIIRHMVGREIQELFPARGAHSGGRVLDVEHLTGARFQDVSFELHQGEILGVAGLVGSGRTSLIRAIFGLEPRTAGAVRLRGKTVEFRSPADAIADGLGYLTEDRAITGIFPQLSVAHNISIAALDRVEKAGLLRLEEEAERCGGLVAELNIRTRSPREPVHRLSGGNQQKTLLARWLFADSSLLLLDEPTQGIDLGARAEIYRLMRAITARGGAVLMASSDLPELLGMSDRILVMRRGRIVAALEGHSATQSEVMRHAT